MSEARTLQQVTTPRCFVDIYPFEGGSYTITGNSAGLQMVSLTKALGAQPGTFNLQLAPGGPLGPNTRPQWLEIITPMSLCVIGMQRTYSRQIVMVGVVLSVSEPQEYLPDRSVSRSFTVQGADIQYFFVQRNFYCLSLLASFGALPTPFSPVGALTTLSDGLLQGSPEQLGHEWFYRVMAGDKGLLSSTSFFYKGNRVRFSDMVTTEFETYPTELKIPTADYFMVNEGSWMFKFAQFFPIPWYELFIITAPPGAYPITKGTVPITEAKTSITMNGFAPVTTQLVARVNPFPYLENTGSAIATGTQPDLSINLTLWEKLPINTADGDIPIAQQITFDEGDVRNFYVLNPLHSPFSYGKDNASIAPFTYTFAAWADPASINRYGYRPQVAEVHWLADMKGLAAQQNTAQNKTFSDFNDMITALSLKQVSYYQPTPMMAHGTAIINLRPDILPGTRFNFRPFKNQQVWQFYVEAVQHSYVFGGQSVTTLQLSRGLPESVYRDAIMMKAIYTGTAMRQNGLYIPALPPGTGQGLQPLNLGSMQGLLGQIAKVFQTPGAT